MTGRARTFELESRARLEALLDRLGSSQRLRAEGRRAERRLYLDTFDWRLHQRGEWLWWEAAGGGVLRLAGGEIGGGRAVRGAGVPELIGDVPAGPLRDELAKGVGVRRLLPLVEVAGHAESWSVLDAEDKTVARLRLLVAAGSVPGAASRRGRLPLILVAEPLTGYGEAWAALVAALEGESGLVPSPRGELEIGLAAIGRRPRDYSSKILVELEWARPAGEAVRLVLAELLRVIDANGEGVRRNLDPEFLHDYRVAVRRTRSALGLIRECLAPDEERSWREVFAELGRVSGPARDLDVYLLNLPGYRAALDPGTASALAPVETFLRRRGAAEHEELARLLASRRHVACLGSWRRLLGLAEPFAAGRGAAEPVGSLAARQLRRLSRRVRRAAGAVGGSATERQVHRLRIRCKKLRYLLEVTRSLYERSDVDPVVSALRDLQDYLGELNDLAVQRDHLAVFAAQMGGEGAAPPETLLAMGRLQAHLEGRRLERLRGFRRRFRTFDSPGVRRRLERLIGQERGRRP